MADALAGLFAQEDEASAGSAAETALAIAQGFDEVAGQRRNFSRLVVDVAVAAQVSGIVVDDFSGLRG